MSKPFVFTLILAVSILSTSCNAYRSTGRKSFESKVSEQQAGVAGFDSPGSATNSDQATNVDDFCWHQPVNDPLWHLEENSSMTVTKINEDEIQVCAIQL